MSKGNVAVLGAGVIGLQTAVSLLEAGFKVTIIAKHFPGDESIEYTSPWAGAQWRTHAFREDKEQQQWDVETYNAWFKIVEAENSTSKETGLELFDSHFYWWYPDPEVSNGDVSKVWFATKVRDFQPIRQETLASGAWAGAKFRSIMVNPRLFLQYLLRRAATLGASIIRATLPTSAGLAAGIDAAERQLPPNARVVDVWVNATGIGALEFVPDSSMFPIRGQTVIVKGQASRITTVEDRNPDCPTVTYVLPRPGLNLSVLGGTKQAGNWESKPDDATTTAIMERAKRWAPELLTGVNGTFEVVDVCVGLRPGRKGGARVELENLPEGRIVCHSYGHAGAGFQNSVGSAAKVVSLIEQRLHARNEAIP